MDIYFYIISDEKNKLNKTLGTATEFNGVLKEQTSVIKPSIVIEAENLSGYNYFYIPMFNRYYFIKDIESIRNGLWRIAGVVDVLMSFKDGIETIPIILANTEITKIENYFSGDTWKTTVKTKTDIISFSSGLNSSGEYILITSGG